MNVFELVASLTLDSSKYDEGLAESESKGGKFGAGLAKAAKGVGVAVTAVTTATAAAGGAFLKGAGDVASYGDNIDKMSQKMGLSAEKYQEWDAILQHSGSSIEAMKGSMKKLATQAVKGNEAFEAIGLTQDQIANMSQEELFEATISGLQNVEDSTQRTYLAGQLLGRGATELGALLNTSAEDTEAMRQRVHELGGVMSDEAVKAAAAYQDSLQDMTTAFDGVKRNMMSSFLPAVTTVMDGLGNLFSGDSETGLGQIKEGVSSFIQNMTDAIPKVLEVGSTIISALGQAIIENLPTLLEAGLQAIVQLATGISDSLPTLIPSIVDAVLMMVDTLLDNIDLLVDAALQLMIGLAEGIVEAIPVIIDKMPQIITAIVQALIKAIPQIAKAGGKLLGSLVKNLPSIIASVVKAAPKIVAALARAFVQGVPSIVKAGFNLISGLGKGIIQGVKNVVASARQAAASVLGAIKGFFGIHSPSRVMMQYGRFLDEGLALGITDNVGIAKRAMENLGDAISEPIAGASIDMGDGFSEEDAYSVLSIPDGSSESGSGRDITVVLQLDRTQLARTVFRLNNEETQRVGVSLSGGYA